MDNSKTTAKKSQRHSRGRGSAIRRKQRRAEHRANQVAELTSNQNELDQLRSLGSEIMIEGRTHETTCSFGRVRSVYCSLKTNRSSKDIRDESSSTESRTFRSQDHLLPEPTSYRRSSNLRCDCSLSRVTTKLNDLTTAANNPVCNSLMNINQNVNKSSQQKSVQNRRVPDEIINSFDAINPVRIDDSLCDQSIQEEGPISLTLPI